MLIREHHALLLSLARIHERDLRQSHALATAQLGPDNVTTTIIGRQLDRAHAAVEALEQEPTRQVA